MASEEKKIILKAAYSYYQGGQLERALEEYRKLLRLEPKDANLHMMVADIQVRRGNNREAVQAYLQAATHFGEQGLLEKELSAYKRVFKVEPGHAVALQKGKESIRRRLTQVADWIRQGRLDEAEQECRRLLDYDSANLEVHRQLDEISAKRTQASAPVVAPSVATQPEDSSLELVEKLFALTESYLQAEDLENAEESLVTILKLKPDHFSAVQRLHEVRALHEKRKQALQIWQEVQSREQVPVEEVKRAKQEAELQANWSAEEAKARQAMQEELSALERAGGNEQAIIERAAEEMRQRLGLAPSTPAASEPAAQDTALLKEQFAREVAEREARFKAETEALRAQVEKERQEAEARAHEREEQMKAEAELLRHQVELARLEAEARAREVASQELSSRIEQERREYEARLAKEREEQLRREEEFRKQMETLLRQQAEQLEQRVREKALEELKAQMAQQQEASSRAQAEAQAQEQAALKQLQEQQNAQRKAQQEAEAKVQGERNLLEKLRAEQEARKQALLEKAKQVRETRQEGPTEVKAEVLKSSRRISDAIRAAATKHLEQDLSAMINAAHSYIRQDLLTDAMKMCQKIVEVDPQNADAKAILKEIFKKKGL